MPLDNLRKQINELDEQIVRLLDQRARVSLRVAEEKRMAGEPSAVYYRPEREREVLERVARANPGALPTESLRAIYREIISASRELQRHHIVAYFGAPASFTHAAALRHFGRQCQFTPIGDIQGIFSAVERGAAHFGVVPIENSTEGIIPATLDQFINSPVRIVAEAYMEVHHNIMATCPLVEVRTVYSHPQPLAQCQGWIHRMLPEVKLVEVSSTPIGAQMARDDPSGAAIGTKLAADLFGLAILEERIEDYAINRTRFWVLGRETPEPSGKDKTSLLFSTRHESGSLFRSLEAFAAHRINLTLIQSRPTKHTAWEYVFFIDFNGHPNQDNVQAAMRELERNSVFVRVLGTYPEAV